MVPTGCLKDSIYIIEFHKIQTGQNFAPGLKTRKCQKTRKSGKYRSLLFFYSWNLFRGISDKNGFSMQKWIKMAYSHSRPRIITQEIPPKS